jgi:general stress protein 26
MQTEYKKDALDFIRENPVCHMATVEDNQPFSRVMWTVKVDDDFTFWYTSAASSQKMRQLEKNPAVCLTMYDRGRDARVFGHASLVTDAELKNHLWKDEWKVYFSGGKDDPEYQVVRIQAKKVEYRDLKKLGMQTATVL